MCGGTDHACVPAAGRGRCAARNSAGHTNLRAFWSASRRRPVKGVTGQPRTCSSSSSGGAIATCSTSASPA